MPNLGQTTSHKQRKFQLINWHTKLTSFKFDSLCYLSLSFHVPNLPNKQPLTLITKTACYPQIPWNTKNKIKTLSKKIQACSLEIVESHQPSSPRYTKRPLILEFLEVSNMLLLPIISNLNIIHQTGDDNTQTYQEEVFIFNLNTKFS